MNLLIRRMVTALVLFATVWTGAQEASAPEKIPGQKDLETLHKLVSGEKNLTWIWTGDSITHGLVHTLGWRSYPEIAFERIRGELGRIQDMMINSGVNGDTVAGILKTYDWRIKRFNPDIVSLKFGMNDCATAKLEDFKRDLQTLVKKIKTDKALVILQTPNTVISGSDRQTKLPPFVEAVRAIAKAEDVILVDHYAKWEKEARPDWYNDSAHPNGKGQLEMAKEIFKTLKLDHKSECLNVKIRSPRLTSSRRATCAFPRRSTLCAAHNPQSDPRRFSRR